MAKKRTATVFQMAIERRAKIKGWNGHRVNAHKEMVRALWLIRADFRAAGSQYLLRVVKAKMILNQVIRDIESLDYALERKHQTVGYLENFSCFSHQAPRAMVMHLVWKDELSVWKAVHGAAKPTPVQTALISGNDIALSAKLATHCFREALRDGFTPEEALQKTYLPFEKMQSAGHIRFFEELSEIVRKHRKKPFQRSLKDWIIRAWLPLCLWECDSVEALKRMEEAAGLLGIAVPNLGQFSAQWSHARREIAERYPEAILPGSRGPRKTR